MNEFSEKDRLALTVYKDSMNKLLKRKIKRQRKYWKIKRKNKNREIKFFWKKKSWSRFKKT